MSRQGTNELGQLASPPTRVRAIAVMWESMHQASSRVYYSCECKLRGWVPGPVYDMLTKKALQQATTWVSAESLKEWDGMRDGRGRHGNGMVRFVGAMRESLDGAADRLPLLRRLQPPGDAVRWVDARRRDAVRFVSSPRLVHSKASWGGLVSL